MKKLSMMMAGLLAAAALSAEEYKSDVFSAEIAPNGVIKNITGCGELLIRQTFLGGNSNPGKDNPKLDGRFLQVADYQNQAKFIREGDTLTVTVQGVMKQLREQNPLAVEYQQKVVFTPGVITFHYEVLTKDEMLSDFVLFQSLSEVPLSMGGRGFLSVSREDVEKTGIIAKDYKAEDKVKYPASKKFAIATTKGVFTVAMDNGWISFSDSRSWGGDHFRLDLQPDVFKWTPDLQTYPVGSKFVWDFTMSFDKNE